MKSTYLYKSSLVIKIALGTAILLIVYITVIFFNQMQNLSISVDSMSTSNQRLLELEKILSTVSSNETSVRSFIISGDSTYLKKRFVGREGLSENFEKLRKLDSTTARHFRTDSLQKLIDRRYALFSKLIDTERKNPKLKSIERNYMLAQGDTLTDKIRDYIYHSLEKEAANVRQSQISHKYEIETSVITSFLLVTIALFILLVSINRISSDLRSMKKLNDELKFLNYTFQNAERIAGMSYWKYNLKTGKYSFSDNFFTLIGADADAFEPTMESVLPYLHPEDRDHVIASYSTSLENKTPTSLVFRLYHKNGEMKYIKSISSFAENSHGELVKIGVNYDITEQYANTENLENKNKDLLAINAELESFNNIVSHDLQEPLRKIQMFISRIDENEFADLSETGKEYFNKITGLANRMQNLLIDLVNYSRTLKGDKAFVKSDLGKILADVVGELSMDIEDKKAIVKVGKLPEITVIPLQIHQLFINLVGNALKFTKPGEAPEIKISHEKIKDGEMCGDMVISDKKFVKIVVSDKGIGFKQEFADKIFLLFRRLEKETYDGTGIGLAICKKIVENHNGYIATESDLGKGAKFMIYLPK